MHQGSQTINCSCTDSPFQSARDFKIEGHFFVEPYFHHAAYIADSYYAFVYPPPCPSFRQSARNQLPPPARSKLRRPPFENVEGTRLPYYLTHPRCENCSGRLYSVYESLCRHPLPRRTKYFARSHCAPEDSSRRNCYVNKRFH